MEKIWREYEIVDIDTGEILTKINNKLYYTVEIEKKKETIKYVQNGYLKKRTKEITRRIVRSKYQTELTF